MEEIYSKSAENLKTLQEGGMPNGDALIRRANKMISEWNIYPAIPTRGDLTFNFIANVRNFEPLFELKALESAILDMMMEQTNCQYDYDEFKELIDISFGRQERDLKIRVLQALISDYKSFVSTLSVKYDNQMNLRPDETAIFYYSYSIYKVSAELGNIDGLFFARQALQALDIFYCEKNKIPYFGISKSGKFLSLSQFKEDKQLYDYIMNLIENSIKQNGGESHKERLNELHSKEKSKKTKAAAGSATNVLIRIAMIFVVWGLCGLYTRIVQFDFDSWIFIVSQVIVIISAILFNVRYKNLAAVIIMDIVIAALLYPLCWVVSWVALAGIIFVVVIAISFFSFVHSD